MSKTYASSTSAYVPVSSPSAPLLSLSPAFLHCTILYFLYIGSCTNYLVGDVGNLVTT